MNIIESISKLFNKGSEKSYKGYFVLIILGVLILIGARFYSPDTKDESKPIGYFNDADEKTEDKNYSLIDDYSNSLENRLENILSLIKGVGKVNVMITLDDTAERIPAINTTTNQEKSSEKDSQGGTREVVREDITKQIVTSNGSGEDNLVVIKEINPEVKGVVVVAQGAHDIVLKEKIYNAVKVALGIPGSRVEVFSSN